MEKKDNTNFNLNLSEFKTLNTEIIENDCIFEVVPIEPQKECPECLSSNIVKNGSYDRFIRDLDYFEYSVGIRLYDNRYLCRDCGKHFVPDYVSIAPKSRLTERLIEKIQQQSLKMPFLRIANEYKVSVPTIKNIFNRYADELESKRVIRAPRVLGIDEAHLNKNACAVFVDVENHLIIELLKTRTKTAVLDYFEKLPNPNDIEVVTMDMWSGYREAVLEYLPKAKIVIDRFHVVKLVTDALNKIKIQKFNDSSVFDLDKRKTKKVLLSNAENLSEDELAYLNRVLAQIPELEKPYCMKEEFRQIYSCNTRQEAEEAYKDWCSKLSDMPDAFKSIKKTVDRWHEYIFNYFDYKYTNGITESLNNVIKSIERAGRGYAFEVLRAKVLFLNSASKPAKFHFSKSSATRNTYGGNTMGFAFVGGFESTKIYDTGSGTDLFELQQLIDDGEF